MHECDRQYLMDVVSLLCDCVDEGSVDFKDLVEDATALEGLKDQLAKEFEVATSTVERWATGVAKPHPRVRKQIVAKIREMVTPP